MKKVLAFAVATAICAALPALAVQDAGGTLYEQEGTLNDGYLTIDATNQGPAHPADSDNWTNWKYQYGGGTWTGVYRKDGWLEVAGSSSGDSEIDIECDIEMYYTEEFSNNKIYFHLGNIYTATQNDKTADVDGQFTSNNGMYIGICFENTSKNPVDMLQDLAGNYTGEIVDAMVGTIDVLGRDITSEAFNVKILMSWDNGVTFHAPDTFGTGASNTIFETLWWLIDNGNAGNYPVKWRIELLPEQHQPDGNYHFDPGVVATPLL